MSAEDFYYLTPYFCVNSSAIHPENLLWSGFSSSLSSKAERYESLMLILEARRRRSFQPADFVRKVVYPEPYQVNWDGETLLEILDLDYLEANLFSPPIADDFTDLELWIAYLESVENDQLKPLRLDIPRVLSHSIPNERLIDYFKHKVAKFRL